MCLEPDVDAHRVYPPETGVFSNATQGADGVLPATLKTVPNVFADAGYRSISLGKWHTPTHPTWQEVDAFIGFPDVAGPAAVLPPFTDEGQRVIKNPGSFMDTVEIPIIIGGIYPYHDWGDDPAKHLTELALDRLRQAAADHEQFFLRVSYVAASHPGPRPDGMVPASTTPMRSSATPSTDAVTTGGPITTDGWPASRRGWSCRSTCGDRRRPTTTRCVPTSITRSAG